MIKYVVDALMEEDEGEDALALTEQQKGFLFLLFKTVIDVLDQKYTNQFRQKPNQYPYNIRTL